MEKASQNYTELVQAFHQTWDTFPGVSRLIDRNDLTIAVDQFAAEHGMEAGQICAKMGAPESHSGCLKHTAMSTGSAQIDRPAANKIRGWLPVDRYPEVVIHFSLALPETNENEEGK